MTDTIHALAERAATAVDGTNAFVEDRLLPRGELYFCTLRPAGDRGRLRQTAHPRSAYNRAIASLLGAVDVYASQAWFGAPSRQRRHASVFSHAWIDLDTYKSGLAGASLEQIVAAIVERCDDHGIPRPSEIVYSGQGVYPKWVFSELRGPETRERVEALNRALCAHFVDLGGDRASTDAARVLRVPGTIHGETGQWVRVVHRERATDGTIRRHALDALADAVGALPRGSAVGRRAGTDGTPAGTTELAENAPHRRRRSADHGPFAATARFWADWHRNVLRDLEVLVTLRWPDGVPVGWRDLVGFLGAVQLAHLHPRDTLWPKIREWAQRFIPHDFVDTNLDAYCTTLLERATRAHHGQFVTAPDGQRVSPIYTYRKTTLRALLHITAEEEPHLRALISADEKRKRARRRAETQRRERGRRTRAAYNADRAARAERRAREIARRRANGQSYEAIAEALGITAKAARRRHEAARHRERRREGR